jgi:hypothetical protein
VKVSRRHGRLRLRLEPAEIELLSTLFNDLDTLLDQAVDPDDEVLQRLYPAAYPDDDAAEVEYRELTESSLRTERNDRIDLCRADLAGAGDIDLGDPDAGRRWIQVLNDLRLALGTRLGITEDDDYEFDPTSAQAQPRVVYYWLTAVQDSVVQGLMR